MESPQLIREYLERKFKTNCKISSNNREFIVPSLFVNDDHKRHMSINSETGLWQCFKTGNTGNFVKLYALLENKTYKRAEAELMLQELQNTPPEFISVGGVGAEYDPKDLLAEEDPLLIPLNINSYETDDKILLDAWKFLMDREAFDLDKYEGEPFYLVKEGIYQNRILIPFRDPEGEMFFFQARALYPSMKPKYLNPPSAKGVHARHVLYPFDETADSVYITEGPFDAITLQLLGLNATCTVGNSISATQLEILKEFDGDIILAYDNDKAGKIGILRFDSARRTNLMPSFKVVTPPDPYKDWNEAHVRGEDIVNWIFHNTVEYSYELGVLESLEELT
jgi:hypothetical protein